MNNYNLLIDVNIVLFGYSRLSLEQKFVVVFWLDCFFQIQQLKSFSCTIVSCNIIHVCAICNLNVHVHIIMIA